MVFSSLVFCACFLPLVLIGHTLIKNRMAQNMLLLVASLVFYAYGEPRYVFLILACALYNYFFALHIHKKGVLPLAVLVNIGVLFFFKYTNFFIATGNDLLNMNLPALSVAMPIGISFFTFQAISYVIDVYQNKIPAEKKLWKLLLYLSFFPQLIAGPIVRYEDIGKAIDERRIDFNHIAAGLRRMIVGLGKKVLLANTIGQTADLIFSRTGHLPLLAAWIGALAYLFQIYYDFSGYSDMAIGMGEMFGFHFKENFNHPYTAVSVQDFWRRWHISLSNWFRDYVYIPLGGNRKGQARTILNRIIVFALTGLWHGASWTFVIWGLYHGLFLLLEEGFKFPRKLPRWAGHVYTMLVVTCGFVIFRSASLRQAGQMIQSMFWSFDGSYRVVYECFNLQFIATFAACFLCQGFVKIKLPDKYSYPLALVLLVCCLLRLATAQYNPFIYFRF